MDASSEPRNQIRQAPRFETTAPRIEVKIPVPLSLLPDMRAWVRVHPAHWRQAYPRRQVNNIYFDTSRYWGLNANLGGVGDRAKLRLRWYGSRLDFVSGGQLELKRKLGIAGWKEILPVDLSMDLRGSTWSQVSSVLGRGSDGAVANWLTAFPVPVLINCYQRDYYTTPDGLLRLTIDDGLKAYGQRSSVYPNVSRPVPLPGAAVVELKAPNDAVALRRLNAVLSRFPLSVDRFSKYVQGAMAAPDLQ